MVTFRRRWGAARTGPAPVGRGRTRRGRNARDRGGGGWDSVELRLPLSDLSEPCGRRLPMPLSLGRWVGVRPAPPFAARPPPSLATASSSLRARPRSTSAAAAPPDPPRPERAGPSGAYVKHLAKLGKR